LYETLGFKKIHSQGIYFLKEWELYYTYPFTLRNNCVDRDFYLKSALFLYF
jgi:hypothetical protein